jgi:hypothetical protein
VAYLLGRGLLEEVATNRAMAHWMLDRLPRKAVEALWTKATSAPSRDEFAWSLTCLTVLGDAALPLMLRELEEDGDNVELAMKVLSQIAADGVTRTMLEWKTWCLERLEKRESEESEEPTGENDRPPREQFRKRIVNPHFGAADDGHHNTPCAANRVYLCSWHAPRFRYSERRQRT